MNIQKLAPDAREYFESLPSYVQESLIQSGINVCGKQELEALAKNLLALHSPEPPSDDSV